jgi:hypothetical protein
MKKIQNELNKLNRQFQPKKGTRVVYQQPARINGRDTYRQPKKAN